MELRFLINFNCHNHTIFMELRHQHNKNPSPTQDARERDSQIIYRHNFD